MRHRLALAPALILAGAVSSSAGDWRVRVYSGLRTDVSTWSANDVRTFDLSAERASLDANYEFPRATGTEGGLLVRVFRGFGLSISGGQGTRDGEAAVSASLPHPLYLGENRSYESQQGGLTVTEQTLFANVGWWTSRGRLELAFSAGPSFHWVDVDILDKLGYVETYPYDSVAPTDSTTVPVASTAVGVNASAQLGWRFAHWVVLGAGVRYCHASATLRGPTDAAVDLDLSGVHILGGLTVTF